MLKQVSSTTSYHLWAARKLAPVSNPTTSVSWCMVCGPWYCSNAHFRLAYRLLSGFQSQTRDSFSKFYVWTVTLPQTCQIAYRLSKVSNMQQPWLQACSIRHHNIKYGSWFYFLIVFWLESSHFNGLVICSSSDAWNDRQGKSPPTSQMRHQAWFHGLIFWLFSDKTHTSSQKFGNIRQLWLLAWSVIRVWLHGYILWLFSGKTASIPIGYPVIYRGSGC
jgi:hypothetical protein